MAVVTRHRKNGSKVYYVKVTWNEREIWERSGTDKRAARSRNAAVLREIREGTYQPKTRRDLTLREWAGEVAKLRTDRSNEDDQRVLANHVLSRDWFAGAKVQDITTAMVRRLLEELRATVSEETGEKLSPKYVGNIYGMVSGLLRRAVRRELIDRNPCDGLERREVVRRSGKRRGAYSLEAVRALCLTPEVHPSARMFAALAFMTGAREGEICGLRWSDWDRASKPLGSLTVARQYAGAVLKTEKFGAGEKTRKVPVHPDLAPLLEWWWSRGFELVHLRPPSAEDPIVPAKGLSPHTRSSAYKLWRNACVKAGVENISLHSTRHSFVTMCRRGGAPADVLERVTHNARGAIIDEYTHFDWAPLCAAVGCMELRDRVVQSMVTPAQSALLLPVEALGIENSAPDVTTRNDSGGSPASRSVEARKNTEIVRGTDAQWDARHQCEGGEEHGNERVRDRDGGSGATEGVEDLSPRLERCWTYEEAWAANPLARLRLEPGRGGAASC